MIDDDFVANFDRTGQTQMPQIKDTSLEYDAKSRQQLEEMMFALNPSLDEEFVRQASNEDLTRATIRTINNELIRLSPRWLIHLLQRPPLLAPLSLPNTNIHTQR